MIYILLGISSILIAFYIFNSLRNAQNSFAVQEVKRYFFKRNKADKNWSSNGRVYTNGIALVKDKTTEKKHFIKQSELCDIGILS